MELVGNVITVIMRQKQSLRLKTLWEHDIEHGQVDENKMKDILNQHAINGWKLHTIYSNELGKNAIRILGLGVNSTACKDVLIFERRVEKL